LPRPHAPSASATTSSATGSKPSKLRANTPSPGRGKLSPFEEENRRRRAENKRLLAERDILKNAAAFFAREAT